MNDTLDIGWLDELAKKLSDTDRKKLLESVIKQLRLRNQQRIREQRNLDGSQYPARKKRLRNKSGKISRRAMFAKLRTNKYMRVRSTADNASITISGGAGFIAYTHHYGIRGRVDKNTDQKVQYPERHILGYTEEDERIIIEKITQYIQDGIL